MKKQNIYWIVAGLLVFAYLVIPKIVESNTPLTITHIKSEKGLFNIQLSTIEGISKSNPLTIALSKYTFKKPEPITGTDSFAIESCLDTNVKWILTKNGIPVDQATKRLGNINSVTERWFINMPTTSLAIGNYNLKTTWFCGNALTPVITGFGDINPDSKTFTLSEQTLSCTNDCSASSKICSGNGYKTCGYYDSDPCLDWSDVNSCSAGTSCSGGQCISGGGGTQCTSFTYSDWSSCSNNIQTRFVLSASPSGCFGGSPELTQSCGGGGGTAVCGNNICEVGENTQSCSQDCKSGFDIMEWWNSLTQMNKMLVVAGIVLLGYLAYTKFGGKK